MRNIALDAFSTNQTTSTGTGDVKTITVPRSTSAVLISVETNPCRITFDGSTPAAGNGNVIPKDALPLLVPLRKGSGLDAIQFTSTIAANSIVNVTFFA